MPFLAFSPSHADFTASGLTQGASLPPPGSNGGSPRSSGPESGSALSEATAFEVGRFTGRDCALGEMTALVAAPGTKGASSRLHELEMRFHSPAQLAARSRGSTPSLIN